MPPWYHVSWASAQLTWWVYDAWVYLSEVFDADLAIYLANVAGEPLLLSTATFHCRLQLPPSTAILHRHLPLPPSTATFHCHPSTATFHWPFSLALFVARSVQPTRATSTGTSSGSGPPRSGRSVRRCGTKEMINPRGPTRRRVISLVAQVQNVSRQVARANQTMASLYGAQPNTSYRRFIQPPCARALSLLSDLLRHMLATSASCPVLRPPAATKHKATRRGRPV